MFGYRLVRENDWDRLQTELVGNRAKVEALLRELTETAAVARSKMTAADHMTLRVNALETEAATLRHKLTGLPQVAPQIGKGTPIMSEALGAGADLFADVGDERADELRAAGLLHEEVPAIDYPSAHELSADAIPQ